MTGVRRALVISLLDRYLALVLALGSSMILARLLTPAQIGLYSVSLAVIGVAQVLRDFGIGNYLIQERNLTEIQQRTAFGITLLLGALLFLPVFVGAPWIARFYGDERMAVTLRICSLNFLVLPFCSISLTLLRRDMLFGRLLYVSLSSALINFAVTLGLAALGTGPDSMAIGAVAANIATGVGAWIARGSPSFLMPSLAEWRRVLNFGGQSALANVITSAAMDVNDLALGKILGFAPVALLSRAQGLVHLFNRELLGAVRNVVYPAYARTRREGLPIEPQHVTTVSSVTVLGWPFFGFLALFPLETLRLMYGPQWDHAASLLPLLASGGAAYCGAAFVLNAIMAEGRIDLVTKTELFYQPLRAGLIVLTALFTQSLLACAAAHAVALALFVPLVLAVKQRCIPNDWQHLRRHVLRSAAVTATSLAFPALISLHAGVGRSQPVDWPWFVGAIIITAIGWILSLRLWRHSLAADPIFSALFGRVPWLRGTPAPVSNL